jgi:CubicO group peptidase (beta-lactamase class C family)
MRQPTRRQNLARFLFPIVATVLVGVPVSAHEATAHPLDGFQQYLDQLLADFGVPGASVAVVGVDADPRVFVSGVMEAGGNRPITPGTLFHIAPMTKARVRGGYR